MGQIGSIGGVWIAVALVLAGLAVTASLVARHHGREPGEWTVWLPGAMVLAASSFLLPRLIVAVGSEADPASDGEVPQLVPDWAFAESTALVAGIAGAAAALAWVIAFVIRARVQHQQSVDADEAVLREARQRAE